MPKRKPPEGLSFDAHRKWINDHKNRNRHTVKFPDDVEEDFQAWRAWNNLSINAAIRRLVATNPDLKQKPNND